MKNKKILLFLLFITTQHIFSFEGGIIINEPTGLTGKYWLNSNNAVDMALGWGIDNNDDRKNSDNFLHIHGDYLWHYFDIDQLNQGRFGFYYGVGGKMVFNDDLGLAARIPLGALYDFEPVPLSVFVEFVPTLNLIPSTDFDLGFAFGVRYLFSRSTSGSGSSSKKSSSNATIFVEPKDNESKSSTTTKKSTKTNKVTTTKKSSSTTKKSTTKPNSSTTSSSTSSTNKDSVEEEIEDESEELDENGENKRPKIKLQW